MKKKMKFWEQIPFVFLVSLASRLKESCDDIYGFVGAGCEQLKSLPIKKQKQNQNQKGKG